MVSKWQNLHFWVNHPHTILPRQFHSKCSYFECQSGGVHCSNSLPGSSKYVCRNLCSSEDGMVLFGKPELRLAKASTTTSKGKQENSRVQEITGLELFRWASEQIKHARLTRSCSQLHIYKVLVIIKQFCHLDLSQDFSSAVDLTGGNKHVRHLMHRITGQFVCLPTSCLALTG